MSSIAYELWAKSAPFRPLWAHLVDVAVVCRELIPCFGGVAGLPDAWTCALVGLHDIGKADPLFQRMDEAQAARLETLGLTFPVQECRFLHERRSADWISRRLQEQDEWKHSAADVVRGALQVHHSRLTSAPPPDKPEWEGYREELTRLLLDLFEVPPLRMIRFDHAGTAGLKLAGLTVLADWIASNPDLFRCAPPGSDEAPREYFARACREARRVVESLHFDPAPAPQPGTASPAFQEVFPDFAAPSPMQCLVEALVTTDQLPPGLLLIEDQMGAGKSEAAFYVVEHWTRTLGRAGAYLALPTAATSNQMHRRYREFLHSRGTQEDVRLVHGMAWLVEDDAPAATGQHSGEPGDDLIALHWFRSTRRALLAAHAVGTVDQALMSVLHVRFGFLRFLGLGRKVLVVDEVHAYDEYMTLILEQLLRWCRVLRIPVILLSATLSLRQKERMLAAFGATVPEVGRAAYPLLTAADFERNVRADTPDSLPPDVVTAAGLKPARDTVIHLVRHPGLLADAPGIARLAAEQAAGGGCVCVLVNTVATAQQVYLELKRNAHASAPDTLFLFHARFRAGERNRREESVVARFGKDAGKGRNPRRPERAILVCTQVVEQSLDVDFDVLITEVAPVDLLLQRCGRMHRHSGNARGPHTERVVHVLLPPEGEWDFGSTERVYADREPLLHTVACLEHLKEFRLPDDFRRLIGAVYDKEPLPPHSVPETLLAAAAEHRDTRDHEARQEAEKHLYHPPDARKFPIREAAVNEDEDGSAAASYFRARTRLGDPTRRVLVLPEGEFAGVLDGDKLPRRGELRRLMLREARLPDWWWQGLDPEEGWEPLAPAPRWLRGRWVLWTREGIWRGRDRSGARVVIEDSPEVGLRRETGERESDDADV